MIGRCIERTVLLKVEKGIMLLVLKTWTDNNKFNVVIDMVIQLIIIQAKLLKNSIFTLFTTNTAISSFKII